MERRAGGESRISPVVARPALPSRPHRYVAATGARLAAADSGEPQATPVGGPSRSHRLWRAAVVLAGPRTLANERRAAVLEIDNQRNRSGSAVQVLLPAGQRSEPAWRVSGTRQRSGNDCISAILGRSRGLPNATSRDRPHERRTRDLPLLGCGAAVHERVLAEHLLDRPAQRLATGRSRRGSVGPRSTTGASDRPGVRAIDYLQAVEHDHRQAQVVESAADQLVVRIRGRLTSTRRPPCVIDPRPSP